MRKTKIICTIGPASENEEVLTQMCLAGMNVARLNFSHGIYPEHEKKIALIKKVREKLNMPVKWGVLPLLNRGQGDCTGLSDRLSI